MTFLPHLLRSATFRQQLTITVAVAVLILALVSSLVSSWQSGRQIRLTLLEQGERMAESLARQSRLALLVESAENAAEAAATTLAFPDVVALEIRYADDRQLMWRGQLDAERYPPMDRRALVRREPFLEAESDDAWRFIAPVFAASVSASPFEAIDRPDVLLGYVRVVQSKATLKRLRAEMFLTNIAVFAGMALLFLLAIRMLTIRLTRPLGQLSAAMARAETGASDVRANLTGPRDIEDMAHTFNRMIAVLGERERELREARDNALRFAQLKSDFAATVSHEIRTPLNGVVGTLDILLATELPQKPRQFVKMAWDSAQYLLELINNILDFSRLEAGRVEMECTAFELAPLIEDVLELVTTLALQKGLDLAYLILPDVPARLVGDPGRLRQVLINLVGNAVKFTDSGNVQVLAQLDERDAERVALRLIVTDTGIGIATDKQIHIFESFTQADPSATRHYGGSGLGLAICKQLVTLMDGDIGVSSAPGQGSRFWVTLPLAAATPPKPPAGPYWPQRRALVMDDNETTRQFVQQALGQWGLHCVGAVDVRSALAELERAARAGEPYHLMVLDGTAGSQVQDEPLLRRWIKQQDGLRLVLMSRFEGDCASLLDLVHAVLSKPLRERTLQEAVAQALGDTGVDKPLSTPGTPPRAADDPCVLVVEDNRTNQAVAQGMLAVLRCQTEIANGGHEALMAFKRQRWDLILMDCHMPEMDGYQVTAAIRALEDHTNQRTPIVAMTANAQSRDVEKCLASGMDDHLSKPLTIERLQEKLRRWMAGYPTPSRSEGQPERMDVSADLGQEPLDSVILAKLKEALGDKLHQAVEPFLEDMPHYLEDMDQALASRQPQRLQRTAHAIKGAAGNLGARHLAAVARDIETLVERQHFDSACELIARLTAEYTVVRQALRAELGAVTHKADLPVDRDARVLVVDDDRSTRCALRYALQRAGLGVDEAVDGAQALTLAERQPPDVILMDAMMPVMDGFTACARLRDTSWGRDIPVLMVTALEDGASIDRAFAVGANDYISKPIHLAAVHQRVRRIIDAHRVQRHVHQLAYTDSLTGLPNRMHFAQELDQAIEHAEARGQSLAVLFLDLDRFKFVNDTLGHEIGDRLLQAVAGRVRQSVRSGDRVARLGGDEFTVLLSEMPDAAAASGVAEKICRALTMPFDIEGHDMFVTASIGISVYPSDGLDVSTLLRHADTAMYRAKRGKGGYQFYERAMEATVSDHLRMESALRRALERQEFLVYYQPKADTATGKIIGMEALVRWAHPTRGLVSPLEFIPLAEETGLIIPIGEWVLRQACTQARRWLDAGVPALSVAVNLSGLQLRQPGFVDLVTSVLRDTGLPAHSLTLEITESMLMDHAEDTVIMLQQLNGIGLLLEIDDFGTGYSSLAYLKRFPVSALKVDRTFTLDMTSNPDAAAIVAGVIALAHSLRLKVVAEGVETSAQRDLLASLGCDSIQGYLLSEPLPASAFERQVLRPHFPHCEFSP